MNIEIKLKPVLCKNCGHPMTIMGTYDEVILDKGETVVIELFCDHCEPEHKMREIIYLTFEDED